MNLNLILGNQLFEDLTFLNPSKDDIFFMCEDYGLCTHFKFHKHKIIFFLASMRNYSDFLISQNFKVKYITLDEDFNLTFEEKLRDFCLEKNIKKIKTYFIEDKFFRERIEKFCIGENIELEIIESPNFLCSNKDFKNYLSSVSNKPFMNSFYIMMRKKLNILVDKNKKPLFEKWSFDTENRKKLPKETFVPSIKIDISNQNLEDVKLLVQKYFKDNFGRCDDFYFGADFKTCKIWFDKFLDERLLSFGKYQDSIDEKTFLFHSVISPYLNSGLLSPKYVVFKILEKFEKDKIPINNVEGFIRQVIGWREFMRGVYNNFDLNKNFFNHTNTLNENWYNGDTGILPLDNAIKKAVKNGYLNHIDRLMIVSNIMLLSKIKPDEVYKWFMELFVDSLDWVMYGNVFGMGQYSDGGVFATKPYICSSNYILKMSNYKKDDGWCKILDSLYWNFIDDNKEVFKKNVRMGMMIKLLEKKDKKEINEMKKIAKEFIERNTK